MSDEQDEGKPLSEGAASAKQGIESMQDWRQFGKDELGFELDSEREDVGGEPPPPPRPPEATTPGRRLSPVLAVFGLLFIAGLVFLAAGLLWAWLSRVDETPDASPQATEASPADAVALGACAVPDEAWEWEVDVTEETSDRGTRTVGEFRFANRSSEDLRIWWLRSATSGDGDVSEAWQGGAPLAPGASETAFVSHAVLSDGTESWALPTHVLAVRDDEACLAAAAAAIEGRSGDDVMVQATPLDLPFGPDAG